MIDWTSIKSTAQSLIGDLSGVKTVWQDEPQGVAFGFDPTIYLRVSAVGDDGIANESRADDVVTSRLASKLSMPLGQAHTGNDSVVTVTSQKHFTLGLRCESFDQDISSTKNAASILETLKTRLSRTTSFNRYVGIFAIQDAKGSTWFNYKNQGRQVSCSTLDILCATVDNDVDITPNAGDFINEVQGTGTVKGNDANLPATINMDINGGI